jgi:hypothetical protein
MEGKDYTYRQLIKLDTTFGGLTKKQSVQSRQLDRRWKKAYNNVMVKHQKAKCRMERRVVDDLCDYYDELMGG